VVTSLSFVFVCFTNKNKTTPTNPSQFLFQIYSLLFSKKIDKAVSISLLDLQFCLFQKEKK